MASDPSSRRESHIRELVACAKRLCIEPNGTGAFDRLQQHAEFVYFVTPSTTRDYARTALRLLRSKEEFCEVPMGDAGLS